MLGMMPCFEALSGIGANGGDVKITHILAGETKIRGRGTSGKVELAIDSTIGEHPEDEGGFVTGDPDAAFNIYCHAVAIRFVEKLDRVVERAVGRDIVAESAIEGLVVVEPFSVGAEADGVGEGEPPGKLLAYAMRR